MERWKSEERGDVDSEEQLMGTKSRICDINSIVGRAVNSLLGL